MIEPHESFFWQMALQSGLVDASRLQQCWDDLPPDRRTAETIDRRLARRVVDAGYLTTWQAQQISRGRGPSLHVNKYTLLDLIGQGGMGRVYLAMDNRLNRRVALKVLSPDRLNDAGSVVRFEREARLGAQLQHENLVRIFDEGQANGHHYLVMEYIEGPSVGHLLTEYGPMPASTAVRLVRQVAMGLDHAFQKGMIHRDVNPYNILVTRDGTAKLTDMGLAIELRDKNVVTIDGTLIGNYDYISPEQVRHSRSADTRSDIYSLGCTLYHMIAGRVPFPSPSLPEKIQSHLQVDPPPLRTIVPSLAVDLAEVVSRMMRKAPEQRYPDPLALARALEPFLGSEPVPDTDGAAANVYRRPGGFDPSETPTQIDPPVTIEDHPESSASLSEAGASLPLTHHDNHLVATLFGTMRPDVVATSPDSRKSGSRWSLPGKGPSTGGRISFGPMTIVAVTLLMSVLLTAKLWRGSQESQPPLEPRGGLRAGPPLGEPTPHLEVTITEADGTETPVRDLKDALRHNPGGDLQILLRGRGPGPIPLNVTETLDVLSGSVTIRADARAQPVLAVTLSGSEPFLRVGPRATLDLEGLAIRVDYPGAGVKPPSLIDARGTLKLGRCVFWTTDPAATSQAVATEGPSFQARGCWFGGFKHCLDVGAFAGTNIVFDQCMIVRSPGSVPSNNWTIRVHHEPTHSGNDPRKLTLRRCTIRDACTLRADDFTPEAPLVVSIEETTVQGGILLAWRSESALSRTALRWSGRDNLYDLSSPSWVIRLDGPMVSADWGDPDSWIKMMRERGSQIRPISAPDPTSTASGLPRPEDYPTQKHGGVLIGADPKQVGPETRPVPPNGPDLSIRKP